MSKKIDISYIIKEDIKIAEIKLNFLAYDYYRISKKGKMINIYSVKKDSDLHNYQKNLLSYLEREINFSNNAYGFIKGKSYLDYLYVHKYEEQDNRIFLKMDIKSFFDSINIKQLVGIVLNEGRIVDNEITRRLLTKIISTNNKLPLGFMTSPILSNLFLNRFDYRIGEYCEKYNIKYSRYVDDLLFSCTNDEKLNKINDSTLKLKNKIFGVVISILKDYGLRVNFNKTIRAENSISIGGFVINKNGLTLSKKKLKKLNTILFIYDQHKNELKQRKISFEEFANKIILNYEFLSIRSLDHLLMYLSGYASFLKDTTNYGLVNNKTKKKMEEIEDFFELYLKSELL